MARGTRTSLPSHKIDTREMPHIKLKHIVSASSEDPAHPADNLLRLETYRKWQCADHTEKQVSVVIELEKASKIHSIDIGNNGSAFVEVLVGRSSSGSSHDYQVLLVASSFMSPAESKSGINRNRVRMFGPEKLSKAVSVQKWDRIKFVCTQPYSKTSSYGLSFVKLHSPPESTDETEPQDKTQSRLGAFTLKDEVEDTIVSGSLFAKRKEKIGEATTSLKSAAAELREASKTQEIHTIQGASAAKEVDKETEMPLGSKRKIKLSPTSKDDNKDITNSTKISSEEKVGRPPSKKVKVSENIGPEVPLRDVLRDVVFVLSGFKNPERGHLRDKALSMGARYRGDWDLTCTHLICAFIRTPKYNQVKASGNGMIVTKDWINDCHKRRKRIAEKKYKLTGDGSDKSETENTEDEEGGNLTPASTIPEPTNDEPDTKASTSKVEARLESKDIGSHNKEIIPSATDPGDESSSGHDTEDEIRRVMEDEEDPYGGSTECDTDDEDETNGKQKDINATVQSLSTNLLDLPDFFSKMVFLLYGEFEPEERRTLTRYITAYNGELEEYMNDDVKYVITNESWDDNFNEALVNNSSLTFVRPKWIYACHEKRSYVPFQPYIVVPR